MYKHPAVKMPFDYNDYQNKVNTLSTEQLQKEWENYTRQIAGGATSTGAAVLFSPLTAGISLIGLSLSTPRIHNARKKRAIIERGLQERGSNHNTRKRDVALPMAISGGIAGLTLGLAGPGADMLGGVAAEKGAEYLVAHAALDGTGAVIEHVHTEHERKSAEQKLQMKMQQQQYLQQQISNHPTHFLQQPNSQVPRYQHQPHSQSQSVYEPVYGSVPIPPSQNGPISYQPTSHQHILLQNCMQPQMARINNEPQAGYQPEYPQLVAQPQAISYQPEDLREQSYDRIQQPWTQNEITHNDIIPEPVAEPSNSQLTEKCNLVTIPTLSAQAGPIPESYFPEKSAAYNASIPQMGQSPCHTPAPVYSDTPAKHSINSNVEENSPTGMSMEEEITLLKARLLAMELEKRGVVLPLPSRVTTQPQPANQQPASLTPTLDSSSLVSDVVVSSEADSSFLTTSEPILAEDLAKGPDTVPMVAASLPLHNISPTISSPPISTPLPTQPVSFQMEQLSPPLPPHSTPQSKPASPSSQPSASTPLPTHPAPVQIEQQYYLPPPVVCASRPISASPLSSTPVQTAQYSSPPPHPPLTGQPLEYQRQPQYVPESLSPNAYNPQDWAQRQQTCPLSSFPNPSYQRHDSGYFSAFQTPLIQQCTPISPQFSQGQYFPQQRTTSVSTMSPPPPYFPPPPGGPLSSLNSTGKDYFNRISVPVPPGGQNFGAPPQPQRGPPPTQTSQGMQGWQWGYAPPVKQEPNYGPPPPIPTAWRGS